jgi:hypothetical protein
MSIFERDQYSVDCSAGSDRAVLRGVMRLASPSAYDAVFAPIRARIASGAPPTIDLTDVTFMNSSGIRALASLVLFAKEKDATLRMVASNGIPWQKKTMSSFRAISPALTIELR